MSLEQFKNNNPFVLDYTPNYIIPMSFIETNDIELNNVLIVFYSLINNKNYFDNRIYHTISFEYSITSNEILNKNFNGFSPNEILIFNKSEKTSLDISNGIKSSDLYKKSYKDCL